MTDTVRCSGVANNEMNRFLDIIVYGTSATFHVFGPASHRNHVGIFSSSISLRWGVGGTVVSKFALRSALTLLSRVRTPPPAPWPDGGPESLRSPCCGLAIRQSTLRMTKKKKQPTELQKCYSLIYHGQCTLSPELQHSVN
ncbi:hypothetical protein PoB_001823800 [Plakobranchus ocellatus]|uniref:Uncharacterized protein n=1 Tax=Plakobranchus ocellatus TaxID=259542 RepID=A0AAV3ZBD3_9GAST|nr:hypothetical protein PoB_001823800 [Plakobranchus ocellatus]